MAQFQLPSASSVIDYLNSNKQDSSFGARSKIYSTAGIDKRLGAFKGSASQNLALLDYLKHQGKNTITPVGANSIVTSAKTSTPSTMPKASTIFDMGRNQAVSTPPDFSKLSTATPNIFEIAKSQGLGATGVPDFSKIVPAPNAPAAPAQGALSTIAPPAPTDQGGASSTQQDTPQDQKDASDPIFHSFSEGEHDYVKEFLDSEAGKALTDKRERGDIDATEANAEAKRLLEAKYASDRSELESKLAENGLAFSGIRNTQLKSLIDELGASELNVDRQLASKLLDSNATLRDGILDGVKELITAAANKDKEAIQQLNAAGFAVVGGKIVQTLAAQNAERSAKQQEIANARAQQNFELSEKRFQLAQEASDRAERRFEQLYGQGKKDFFKAMTMLVNNASGATEQDLKLAIRSNPDIFGSPSEAELKDALSLIGVPQERQQTIASSLVGSVLKIPFNIPLLGKSGAQLKEDALDEAKQKAVQSLIDSNGVVEGSDASGDFSYKLNSDQLQHLIETVKSVTLDEAKAAQ